MTKLRNRPTQIVLCAVLATMAAVTVVLVVYKNGQKQASKKPAAETVTILPMQAPKVGERLRDIPANDQSRRLDLLKAGAVAYGVPLAEAQSQKTIATACVADATARITSDARMSEKYRKDTDKIKADVEAVNKNCYAKYSDTDYVKPPPAQSHVNHQTFEHH